MGVSRCLLSAIEQWEKSVYYILNMECILQKRMDSLHEALIHPPEPNEARFITDARTLFHVFWTVDKKHQLNPLRGQDHF